MIIINEFNMKQKLNVGDLCILAGYGRRIWEVTGWVKELSYMNGKLSEEIIYNLSCVMTSEWSIGVQEETTLVCRAKYSLEYIRMLNGDGKPPKINEIEGILQDLESLKEGEELYMKKRIDESEATHIYPDTKDGLLEKLGDLKFLEWVLGENDDFSLEIEMTIHELEKKRKEEQQT